MAVKIYHYNITNSFPNRCCRTGLVLEQTSACEARIYRPVHHGVWRLARRHRVLSGALTRRGACARKAAVCHGNDNDSVLHGVCTGILMDE